jgi:hypothetical protein
VGDAAESDSLYPGWMCHFAGYPMARPSRSYARLIGSLAGLSAKYPVEHSLSFKKLKSSLSNQRNFAAAKYDLGPKLDCNT